MARLFALVLTALLVLAPMSGCIFFAPNIDPLDNCPIKGDSLCGTCIRSKCQAEVNNCCGAEACRESGISTVFTSKTEEGTTMAALDVCAGDGTKCAAALASVNRSAEGTVVNTCITTNCADACATTSATLPTTEWTCSTAASSKPCDACIHTSCADELKGCCGDASSCSSALGKEMGDCVTGDEAGCAQMKSGSLSGKDGVVRKCVKSNCAAECFGNGFPHQRCSLQGGGDYCACNNAQSASGDECSSTSVAGSRCFFTSGGCICGHYACKMTSTSSTATCTCTLTNEEDSGGCDPSDFSLSAHCCLKVGSTYESPSCKCTTIGASCFSDETEVFSCDKGSFSSAMSELRTDRCSQ